MKEKILFMFLLGLFLISFVSAAVVNISDCDDWLNITSNSSTDYTLTNDIDCSGYTQNHVYSIGYANITGNSYTISNLVIIECSFGSIGVMKDLFFENVTVYDSGGSSGIFCSSGTSNVIIQNVHATGNVYGGDYEYSGGLVQQNEGVMDNCSFIGYVEGAGGLVGQNDATIKNSYFIGTLNSTLSTVSNSADGIGLGGGLVGWNFGYIETSYAKGDVYGLNATGGLVGESYGFSGDYLGIVNNSYFIGNVSGDSYLGGLIGYAVNGSYGDIFNSYAVADVNGIAYIGGLIGDVDAAECFDSYYNTDLETNSSCGTGKTTEEMVLEATYENWDFVNIWQIDEGETYPYFLYEESGYSPFPPEVPSEEEPQYLSNPIYQLLDSVGAGLYFFIFNIGRALPYLLIVLIIVGVIYMMIKDIAAKITDSIKIRK